MAAVQGENNSYWWWCEAERLWFMEPYARQPKVDDSPVSNQQGRWVERERAKLFDWQPAAAQDAAQALVPMGVALKLSQPPVVSPSSALAAALADDRNLRTSRELTDARPRGGLR